MATTGSLLNLNTSYNEAEILARITDGDEHAFGLFYKVHYARLRPFVGRFFPDPAQADDALQESFIKVWLNRDKLLEIENINAWLHTIVSRICISALRKDLTYEKHAKEFTSLLESGPETPAETAYASEIRRLVAGAVENMPPSRKRIYLLSRQEGLKPAEIAEILSLSVNTVRNTLVTALKEIREYLRIHGHLVSLFLTVSMTFGKW